MVDESSQPEPADASSSAPAPSSTVGDPAEALESAAAELDEEVAETVRDTQAAIADARARLAEAPPEVIVTNHAMGLYELAAIHLSATPPNLPAAALAIDAFATLVEGLGDRIGENAPMLRDALGNIRMAFVQLKAAGGATAAGAGTSADATGTS